MVATYPIAGGIPEDNVRLLQDWSALRPDIEEALLDWLPSKITKDSIVTVYFAGQAIVSPTGETFLIPYDGAIESTPRLYPLKDLETLWEDSKPNKFIHIRWHSTQKRGRGRTKVRHQNGPGSNESVIHLLATTGSERAWNDIASRIVHILFSPRASR